MLGHGAGTNVRHPFMEQLAQALAAAGVATFRFNYPYSEAGRGGMDGERVRLATVRAAIAAAATAAPDLPRFAGGHSMSGRMATLAVAKGLVSDLAGIVAFAFPLHQAGRPDVMRARHLADVDAPLLFLSGDRDRMAQIDLLRAAIDGLRAPVRLHVLPSRGPQLQGPEALWAHCGRRAGRGRTCNGGLDSRASRAITGRC